MSRFFKTVVESGQTLWAPNFDDTTDIMGIFFEFMVKIMVNIIFVMLTFFNKKINIMKIMLTIFFIFCLDCLLAKASFTS